MVTLRSRSLPVCPATVSSSTMISSCSLSWNCAPSTHTTVRRQRSTPDVASPRARSDGASRTCVNNDPVATWESKTHAASAPGLEKSVHRKP